MGGVLVPIGEWVGNNARDLLRKAREESLSLDDPEEYERAMNRVVNKIGSTAREVQWGDYYSAMFRGLKQGSKDAWILAKMGGAKEEELEKARFKNPFIEKVVTHE
ncbi:MAG: hypothetical protein HPY71_13160 [Firmicutes bacterium]|nr:hypothetical protein [Bacillota bacterium]